MRVSFEIDWEKKYTPSVSQIKDIESEEMSLRSLQEKDRALQVVKTWVTEGKKHSYSAISSEGRVPKSLWSQFESLKVNDGILYREWVDGKEAVVPSNKRRTVLAQYHDNRSSGHFGVSKTLSKIRQGYYWPGLQADVRSHIAGCDKCSRRKGFQQSKRAPMQLYQSGALMERIATDILGELTITDKGTIHLSGIDYYSKWTESFLMKNMESEAVAKIIVEQLLTRLGVPYAIHSDQGTQFESRLFGEVCKLFRIKKTHTTPYLPKSVW
jgi:hypothetical protein